MGLCSVETTCFNRTQPPFFLYAHVWCVVLCACSASVCVCVGCVLIKGVYPFFFMPTLRGAVGCLCSRIRDYVNPWSVPGCGCGGGVFVITDSRTRIRGGGCENTYRTTRTISPAILYPCYRITAPVNKRGRPVRGSINSSSVLVRCMGRE